MNRITPSDIGQRVTLQFLLPDGSRTEAAGEFEAIANTESGVVLTIRKKDLSAVAVPLASILHGKVIAAKRS